MHDSLPSRKGFSPLQMKYLFAAIMFTIGIDIFIMSPLLPTLRIEFGIGADTSGWLMSAYSLGYAVTALIAGPLTERMNRKKVLIAGLAAFAVCTALCGTAHGFNTMFLFRFLAGVAAAITTPQVWASIPQTVAGPLVLKTMGWATAGLSLAQVLGIPLGSLLAHQSWRFPFFAVGLLTLPVIAWIAASMPAIQLAGTASKRLSIVASYQRILGKSESRYAFMAHFFYFFGTFGSFTFIGNWMGDEFGLDVAQIGVLMIAYGAGNLAGGLCGSRITAVLGPKRSWTAAALAIGLLFAAAPMMHAIWAVLPLLLLSSFCGGLAFPLIMNTLQSIDIQMRGTLSSLANSVMYMGTTVGAAIAGGLYVRFGGFRSVGLMVLIAMLTALVLFYRSGLFGSEASVPASAAGKAAAND